MSATYITNNGILQFTGIITAAQINALGSSPFIFTTPANFGPLAFCIKPISGTIQPFFTDNLNVQTVDLQRTIFVGADPAAIDLYNFYGYITRPLGLPTHCAALNINCSLENNFMLIPADGQDPTPGDYEYKFNLIGQILI